MHVSGEISRGEREFLAHAQDYEIVGLSETWWDGFHDRSADTGREAQEAREPSALQDGLTGCNLVVLVMKGAKRRCAGVRQKTNVAEIVTGLCDRPPNWHKEADGRVYPMNIRRENKRTTDGKRMSDKGQAGRGSEHPIELWMSLLIAVDLD